MRAVTSSPLLRRSNPVLRGRDITRLIPFALQRLGHLLEADLRRALAEALAAHVQPVLADERVRVAADAARARAGGMVLRVRVPDVLVAHVGGEVREGRRTAGAR